MKIDNIYLRPFVLDDHLLINKWRNDKSIQALISSNFRYVSIELERKWVELKMISNLTETYLAICCSKEHKMVGYISLNDINHLHQSATCGGIVIGDPDYRDGDTIIASLLLISNYAFESLNLNRLSGSCIAEQKTTLLVSLLLGFKIEGQKRSSIYKDGFFHDEIIFSLLRSDYFKMKEDGGYLLDNIYKRIKETKNFLKNYTVKI